MGLGLPSKIVRDKGGVLANKIIEELSRKYENVEFISLDNIPIFNDAPFYKNKLIYMDGHHLNEVGAMQYAEYVKPLFNDKIIRK